MKKSLDINYVYNIGGFFGVNLPTLIFGFILIGYSSASGYDFSQLGKSNCSDDITTFASSNFTANMRSAGSMGTGYLITGILGCIANCVLIYIKWTTRNDWSNAENNKDSESDKLLKKDLQNPIDLGTPDK